MEQYSMYYYNVTSSFPVWCPVPRSHRMRVSTVNEIVDNVVVEYYYIIDCHRINTSAT